MRQINKIKALVSFEKNRNFKKMNISRMINDRYLFCKMAVFIVFLMLSSLSFSQNSLKEKNEILYSKPPTAGIIKLVLDPEFSEDDELKLALYDLSGVLEKSTTVQITKETTTISWDTNTKGFRTPTGVYKLKITGSTHSIQKRLIMDCGCKE
ncbi:MAG: T9SS type A sorting domain-containing protein [Algibacter sp.]